eukprot:scaffold3820_cov415-Prasinococcus_capsulatus_cf.AAC.13
MAQKRSPPVVNASRHHTSGDNLQSGGMCSLAARISCICLAGFCGSLGSENGYLPTNITYSITPRLQMSAAFPSYLRISLVFSSYSPDSISGHMYAGVPTGSQLAAVRTRALAHSHMTHVDGGAGHHLAAYSQAGHQTLGDERN